MNTGAIVVRSVGALPILQVNKKKQFTKNPSKKFDLLNEIVSNYQLHKRDSDLRTILKLTHGLRYKVLDMYDIHKLNSEIIEDVMADVMSRVLIKAITTYDSNRGSFSTHYVWQMRSFVAYRKRYYTQRHNLIHGLRLNMVPDESASKGEYSHSLEDHINPFYNNRLFSSVKRAMSDMIPV